MSLMKTIMNVWSVDEWLKLTPTYRMYVRVNYLKRMQIRERKPNAQVFQMSDYRR
jgi:hypothetical protein